MAINSVKEDEEIKEVVKIKTVRRLFKYMLSYKKEIIKVLLLMAIIVGISIVNPIIIQIAIDDYVAAKDISGLAMLAVIVVVINLFSAICSRKRITLMGDVTNKVLMEIRLELYKHIQTLSFKFFDSRPTGKILARVVGDVNSLKDVLNNSVVTLVPELITIVVVLIVMLIINFKLALAAVMLLPFLIVGVWIVQIKSHKKWQIVRKKKSNINAYTFEDFSGIRVVQSFCAEERTSKSFRQLLKEHNKSFREAIFINNLFWPMIELSWGVGTVLIFVFTVKIIGVSEVSVGTLMAFMIYQSMFWQPIMNLSDYYIQLLSNLAGAERIFEILDEKPDIVNKQDAIVMPEIKGDIAFDHVTFSYDDKVNVLEDLSLNIHAGEMVALVGATGGGKSTIANLVSRFYDINEGTISIDGYNLQEVLLESLRCQMGVMTQDTFLFTGTVADNIRYGKLDATMDEVIEAAKAVHAHEFIMDLKEGYDTMLKEEGAKLSVGQKQLIAFARTMISKPNILILDEATSSIDTKTERLVQQGIKELLKGRTSIVIAHRLSTIKSADRIFVIGNKGIIESGSHDELMAKQGDYYRLQAVQKAGA